MPVGFKNLTGEVQSILSNAYPDVGQTFYVVDSDYRTAAQGWSQADGTGPLDLWKNRPENRVFYTPGTGNPSPGRYATDEAAVQGAIDAMVDFRGDTLLFTPGDYSFATRIDLDVVDGRFLGPPVINPRSARVRLNDGAAAVVPVSSSDGADRMEIAFINFYSDTDLADAIVELIGTDNFHIHHCWTDIRDGTLGTDVFPFEIVTTAVNGGVISDCIYDVDGAAAPFLTTTANWVDGVLARTDVNIDAGTIAYSHLDIVGTGAQNNVAIENKAITGNGGAATVMFRVADCTSNTEVLWMIRNLGSVAGPAATAMATVTGADGEVCETGFTGGLALASADGTSASYNEVAYNTA